MIIYYLLLLVAALPSECGPVFSPTAMPSLSNQEICQVAPVIDSIQIGNCYLKGKILRCRGACYSSDGLDGLTIGKKKQSDSCKCCLPVYFERKAYQFKCFDGNGKAYLKDIMLKVPSACRCSTCSSQKVADTKSDLLLIRRRIRKYF
jgi:hypothetical protein